MSPPIRTPDGNEVSEIVLPNGATASEVIGPDGNVVFEAGPDIPDSAVAQWDARDLSGFNDGNTVSAWTDAVEGYEITGSATYRASAINNNPALEFGGHGSGDGFVADLGVTWNQKVTIFAVVSPNFSDLTNERYPVTWDEGGDSGVHLQYNKLGWVVFAGDSVAGSNTADRQLLTTVADGSNSLVREDGTQTDSGNAGTNSHPGTAIGVRSSETTDVFEGDIGFVEFHEGAVSGGLETREQEIADEWGITLA